MKVLVTGSSGLVGTALVKALKLRQDVDTIYGVNRQNGLYGAPNKTESNSSCQYHQLYCPLDKEVWAQSLLSSVNPDIVFALASQNCPDCFLNNILSTYYTAKYCPPTSKLIFLSSHKVYGNLSTKRDEDFDATPCSETDITVPIDIFGASKLAGEAVVNTLPSYVIVRPCEITSVLSKKGAVADIVQKIRKANVPTVELLDVVQPFVNVDDVVNSLLYLGFGPYSGTYNLSANDELPVDEVAKIIMNKLQTRKSMTLLPKGLFITRIDNSKLEKAGFTVSYESSREAIEASIPI